MAADLRDGLDIVPYEFHHGPQLFVAQDRKGNREYIRVSVRRETPDEQRARQKAFAADRAYIDATLVPGEPVYAKHITLGA